jgi:hypothetical protein
LVGFSVEGSNLERKDLNSVKESLAVLEELLSVPVIVEGLFLVGGVTDSSGVSSGNEVSDASSNS